MKKRSWCMFMVFWILAFVAIGAQGNGNGNGHGNGNNGNGNGNGHGNKAGEAPVTANDQATTAENTPVTIPVLANDTDADNDIDPNTIDFDPAAGVQSTFATPKGSFSADTDGVVTFTPTTNTNGPATISYSVSDLEGNVSNPANIDVTVTHANVAPVASNDTGATTNDAEVQVDVLANDSDSDGELDTSKVDIDVALAGIQKSNNQEDGDWTVNKGVVKYKPAKDFVGSATLNYVVYDDENESSNVATLTITVTSANAAPIAANDAGGTTLNKPTTVNVTANDTDADGTIDKTKVDLNTTTAGLQQNVNNSQGNWTVDANGIVTFTPLSLFVGTASLNYTVMDNQGTVSNAAKITINVQFINMAPTANNDNVTTTKNKAVTIKVTENDTDSDGSIDVTKVDLNANLAGVQNTATSPQGNYSVDALGTVTFTPANNFTGVAALGYTVADNAGATSNSATISITVQDVNSPPEAGDDTGVTAENTNVSINVVANDIDTDGVIDAAKVDLQTNKAGIQNSVDVPQGSFSASNLGIVTYVPKKDFTGSVVLNYTVDDNTGAVSNVAKITIAVQPVNAPLAKEDVITTSVNTSVDIDVVANDTDSDGTVDASSVDLNVKTNGVQRSATSPEGNYTVNELGIVTFTPRTDYIGAASIEYTVKDDKGVLSNPALISITIQRNPNVAPVIITFEEETDTLRYTPGNPIQISDEFEADDVDGDSLATAEIGFVTGNYSKGSDKFIFENTSSIKAEFDETTGLLILRGPARIRDFNTAVRSVKYEFTGNVENHNTMKRIYVRVSDGMAFSELKQRVIKINSSVTGLDIPTAFTPNSDGANDTWRILAPTDISGSDFADAEVKVYDKRGTMVFDTNGLGSTWDGTYQGKQLPVDTYYYTIDLKQQQKRYKGVVAILR
jgi:gliding motility-associated-like protein